MGCNVFPKCVAFIMQIDEGLYKENNNL